MTLRLGRLKLLPVLLLFAFQPALAQTPEVTANDAREHLLEHPDALYPPIARAAHVQGDVVLKIEIDDTGQVTAVHFISGPAMLRSAAESAVRKWKYRPFYKDGTVRSVYAEVTVPFHLSPENPEELSIARVYFPLFNSCVQALSQRSDPPAQVKLCRAAADEADKFPQTARFIERRSAYVYYATALVNNKQYSEAVRSGDKAIAVVLQGHDDGSGSSAAYGVTGQAKALGGDFAGGDYDLEIAEKFQREALTGPAGHSRSMAYTQVLKGLLLFHGEILKAAGETSRAQGKLDEASRL